VFVLKRIKILIIIGQLELGGAENHLLNVLPKLDLNRFEPIVYSLRAHGLLLSSMEDSGVRVIHSETRLKGFISIIPIIHAAIKNDCIKIFLIFSPDSAMR